MYVGRKLRKLRLSRELTQAEMATALGLSQSYYSAIESGKRRITGKMIQKIEDKLDVNEGYFLDKVGAKDENKMRGLNEGVDEGVAYPSSGDSLEKRRFKPYYFYNRLSVNDLNFEISIELEKLKDIYNDYSSLVLVTHRLNAPDFIKQKFPLSPNFNSAFKEWENDFIEEHKHLTDPVRLKVIKIVDFYQSHQDHFSLQLSLLISYLKQYLDFFEPDIRALKKP